MKEKPFPFLLYFFSLTSLSAQPLPLQISFTSTSDTLRAFCRTFAGGWTAQTYRVVNNVQEPLWLDSLFIDSLLRLIRHTRYEVQQGALLPVEQWRFVYPHSGLYACTEENYDRQLNTYLPRRRFYLWGAAKQWDSVLRSWTGVLGLDWDYFYGHILIPHPVLSEASLWGDSLMIEDFFPGVQAFVAVGGYGRVGGSPCDTLYVYEQQGIQRILKGFRVLCRDQRGALTYTQDTTCSAGQCTAERRIFSYDVHGKLIRDSLLLSIYTPQGQPVGSTAAVRKYTWDSYGRLIRAEYPQGVYELTYGQQVVTLPYETVVAGSGRLRLFSPAVMVKLYNTWGGLVGALVSDERGEVVLPPDLPAGLYFYWTEKASGKIYWHGP
ncbi:MAG: hypothetical protein N2253_09085 [Bacteroidia bacterium]|nr:hypothetical protein [Bacteroidia bacterium]MDW8058430.1 hypothetical protein [Bacteroidia bacterium]